MLLRRTVRFGSTMTPLLSLFPKCLAGLTPDNLAQGIAKTGVHQVDAVVRDGFWTALPSLEHTLPDYVRALAEAGLAVRNAVLDLDAAALADREDVLACLAREGLTDVRFRWFSPSDNAREALDQAQRDLDRLGPLLGRHRMRGVIQLHFGTLIASPSAAFSLLRHRDPAQFAVQLDPANQVWEGHEAPDYATSLLGPWLRSVGVKDVLVARVPGTRSPVQQEHRWVPLGDGVVDWPGTLAALRRIQYAGVFNLMPFAHPDDPHATLALVAQDVATLTDLWATSADPCEGLP